MVSPTPPRRRDRAALLVALAVPYATLGTRNSDAFNLPGLE
ncbi:hypothetical protein [Streptomyces sp. NPDC001100]